MTEIHVVPPELQSKIGEWRRKASEGTITKDEMKQAIIAIRMGRRSAAEAAAASGKSRKKTPVNTADLLSELDSM